MQAGAPCVSFHPQGARQRPPIGGSRRPYRDVARGNALGFGLDFDIAAALKTLHHFGLARYEAERLTVLPLEQAITQLREVWNNFFKKQR